MKLITKQMDELLFKQYAIGGSLEHQMVVAKIFNPYGQGVWYLLNSDPEDPDYLWAIVDLFEVEVGSVSREELESITVPPFGQHLERDQYFTSINALECYKALLEGKQFGKGGHISKFKKGHVDNIPEIVKRAMIESVTNIGQLSAEQIKDLNKYVKSGVLVKGKGGSYPALKTVYAIKGHDFISQRKDAIDEMMRISDFEQGRNTKFAKGGTADENDNENDHDSIYGIEQQEYGKDRTPHYFIYDKLSGEQVADFASKKEADAWVSKNKFAKGGSTADYSISETHQGFVVIDAEGFDMIGEYFDTREQAEAAAKDHVKHMADGGSADDVWIRIDDRKQYLGKKGLDRIKAYSKQHPKDIFLVTDDNYSNIGHYFLKNGKFAKAETIGNPNYDLINAPVTLKGKEDVIYKFRQSNKPGKYSGGGMTEDDFEEIRNRIKAAKSVREIIDIMTEGDEFKKGANGEESLTKLRASMQKEMNRKFKGDLTKVKDHFIREMNKHEAFYGMGDEFNSGGKIPSTPAAKKKIAKVMTEFKEGSLTSHGKKVTQESQAKAIALSEARAVMQKRKNR